MAERQPNIRRLLRASMLVLGLILPSGCHYKPRPIVLLPNTAWETQELWKQAALQVEQDRNEPVGARAKVEVPEELRQYGNRHQFLGTQVAEFHKQGYGIPRDYGNLVELIQGGQVVEMPAVGKDYVLFGIGGRADRSPLTRYDPESGSSIPLYANEIEVSKAASELGRQIEEAASAIAEARRQLRVLGRRDRRRGATLRAEISSKEALVASLGQAKTQLDWWYGDASRRRALVAEYDRIADFASDFQGASYDLRDPDARLQFKLRLLSYIRQPARAVIEELAASYDRQFGRPLPVTSMIRTLEYQKELGEVNPNAARNAVPPHTTGLAFDIYYHYMTATEQDFLMKEIARMKDAGRIEALRETRDHFHIFAFAGGQRPPEQLIAESTSEVGDNGTAVGLRARVAKSILWKPRPGVFRTASHRKSRS